MKEFSCPRCGHSTFKKSNIRDHVNRKRICKPVLSNLIPKEHIDDILKGVYIQSEVELLKKALRKQEEEIKRLREEKTIVNNITNNITNNNVVNITLPYRETNHDFLSDSDYLRCINRMIMSVPNLIKRIHFNPEHPENHNIYINDMSRNLIMVYDGTQWNVQNQKDTIDRLINDHEFLLDEWVEYGAEKYPNAMKKFKDYVELRSKNEVEEKIKDEVRYILYNNRDLVCNKE